MGTGADHQGDTQRPLLDLWVIVALVAVTGLVVFLPVIRESPIRVVVALGFVLFAPGYALIAALFPEAGARGASDETMGDGIDGLERAVLSFGASIAIVPLVGLLLNFTPWGITLAPIIVSLGSLTLLLIAVAGVRRLRLPPAERFTVSIPTFDGVRDEFLQPTDRTDAVLNVVLVLSLLVAASSVAFAIAAPTQGESFTELSLLTETEDGNLTASNYPQNFTQGEAKPLTVSITNQEGKQANYTLIAELQRVNVSEEGEIRVEEVNELDRFSPTLAANETWRQQHLVEPQLTGERLRLQYSLYRGGASSNQSDDAYRTVQLWVNVSTAGDT